MPNRRSPWMAAAGGAVGAAARQFQVESECQNKVKELQAQLQALRMMMGFGGGGMPTGASMFQPGFNTPEYGAPSDAGNLFGQLGQMQQGNPNIAPGPLPGGPATPPWSPNIQPNWLGPGFKGQF